MLYEEARPGRQIVTMLGIRSAALLTEDTSTTAPGKAIQISATVAGTVTLTLFDGSLIIVNVVVGDNIYPYSVSKATVGTATISNYYNLEPVTGGT